MKLHSSTSRMVHVIALPPFDIGKLLLPTLVLPLSEVLIIRYSAGKLRAPLVYRLLDTFLVPLKACLATCWRTTPPHFDQVTSLPDCALTPSTLRTRRDVLGCVWAILARRSMRDRTLTLLPPSPFAVAPPLNPNQETHLDKVFCGLRFRPAPYSPVGSREWSTSTRF